MPETFTPKTWADGSGGGTPITAAELNRLEVGVESMDDRVAALEAAAPGGGGGGHTFTADDTGATPVQSALLTQASAAAAAGQPLIIPPGDYLITSEATIPPNTTLWAPSGARFFGDMTGSAVLRLSSGCTLRGVTAENGNVDSAGRSISIAQDSENVLIEYCTVLNSEIGVYASESGIKNVMIRNCRMQAVWWGVLTNPGANDLVGFVVSDCYMYVFGDGVEFNHPSAGGPTCYGFRVANNIITVPDHPSVGSPNAGFGIGVAGCDSVTITGNTVLTARREGIHVEDGARRVTITGNTVKLVPPDSVYAHGGIVVYPFDSCDVTISDNVVENITGIGIWIIYASDDIQVYGVTITGNVVRNTTDVGIYAGADVGKGGRFLIANNMVHNAAGSGITVLGDHPESIIHDNLITSCDGYGIDLPSGGAAGAIRSIRGNVITDCAMGDYYGASNVPTVLRDRTVRVAASTASAGTTSTVTLMGLGRYASGKVTFQAFQIGTFANRVTSVWDIGWDGSSLTATRVHHYTAGTLTHNSMAMTSGRLTASLTVPGAGTQLTATATFDGICLEDGSTPELTAPADPGGTTLGGLVMRQVISGSGNHDNVDGADLVTSANVRVGDTIIAVHGNDWNTDANMAPPGGTLAWELVHNSGGGYNTAHFKVWKAVAEVDGPITISIEPAVTGSDSYAGAVYAFKGAVDIIAAASTMQAVTPGTSHVAPSVTATAANQVLLCAWQMTYHASTTSSYSGVPAGMTQQALLNPTNDGIPSPMLTATQVLAGAGATGTRTATASASRLWAAASVILAAG